MQARGSSSCSMEASPSKAKGQLKVTSSGAFHSSHTLLKAPQARCAGGQSSRQCWGDSGAPELQVLQVGEIPITCSQVPVGRP